MSNSPDPVYTPRPEPSASNLSVSVLGILGCFLIFGFVLVVAYVPSRKEPVQVDLSSVDESERWKLDPAARRMKLVELQGASSGRATNYEWIDQQGKVVRLPISRAIDLVVQEQAAKK